MNIPNTTPLIRLALALAVSPLVAASSLNSWWMIVEAIPDLRIHAMPIKDPIGFSYLVVVSCSLPLVGLFALLRWQQWWHYAVTGFVMGIGIMILAYQLLATGGGPETGSGNVFQAIDWVRTVIIGITACTTALAFWWLRYGNLRWFGLPSASGKSEI
jgi:hypothetical protein